ncbi:zinc finger protein 586-like [Dryobates pubescens]|uniref:zinc finger protein 586-like n=1 Tax=Dryobates pubescens TaxID=118200 RepID=UPI0023BA39B1|nr:zinc finger protein 586-like [Dryobates pubescens]
MPPGGEQGKRRDERGFPEGLRIPTGGELGAPERSGDPPAGACPSAVAGQTQVPVTFEDVAVYLSRAEWEAISEEQQELYRSVMLDVCELLRSLGKHSVSSWARLAL